jgi:acyl carrier protein
MKHIEEKVKELVAQQFGVVVSNETLLSEIVEDSLSKIDLLCEIERS